MKTIRQIRKRPAPVFLLLAVQAALSSQAQAQGNAPATAQTGQGGDASTITITGSRILRDREAASVPVTTVRDTDLKLSGTVNAEELLNSLPQFVPATTSASNSLASATGTGAATVDLRGLGANRNLVLVNGRRYVFFDASQVTNINTIPAALIRRVEVVTGGASAVYGSDAISGVVNYILRDDFDGVEARAQVGLDSRGDGGVADFTLTAGRALGGGRGNAVLSLNYVDRQPILTSERGYSAVNLVDVTVGGVRQLGPGGSSFVPNGRYFGLPTTPAAIAARPGLAAAYAAAGLTGIGANGFIPDDSGSNVRPYNAGTDFFDFLRDNYLRVPQQRLALTSLAHYDLSDRVTAFFEGAYSRNKTTVGFASSFINETLPIEVNNPYIGAGLRGVLQTLDQTETGAAANDGRVNLGFARRLIEAGPRRNLDERDAWRVLLGLRGDLGSVGPATDLAWETYVSYARSKNTQLQTGNVSRTAFARGLLSAPGSGAAPVVNPFGPNISAAGIEAIQVESVNIDDTDLKVAAANLNGKLWQLPAGRMSFSLGGEWRASSVDFQPDVLLAAGDIAGFNPITATNGEIKVWELLGELRVPLLKDAAIAKELAVNVAARYSDYDLQAVGGVWTYQAGIDWQLNNQVSAGAQFQRAIRAPNVGEAFGGTRNFPVAATDPCAQQAAVTNAALRALCISTGVPAAAAGTAALQPNAQIPGVLGGNPSLNEESSDTFTTGLVLTPSAMPGFRATLDYYDIRVTGAISPLAGGVNSILDLCYNQIREADSVACRAISRNPASGVIDVQFPVTALNENIGRLQTSGVDLQLNQRLNAAFGLFGNTSRFDLALAASWLRRFTVTPVQELPGQFNDCTGLYGPTCGEPKAKLKTTTRLSWTTGPLLLSVRHRHLGAVGLDVLQLPARRGATAPAASTEAVPRIAAQNYIDLSFNLQLNPQVALWGGINNVFDKTPPLLGSRQRRNNTYPDTYDYAGAEFFLGASARF